MPVSTPQPCFVILDPTRSRPVGLVRARLRSLRDITADEALRAWAASPHADETSCVALAPDALTPAMKECPGTIPIVLVTE
jgi:hypothetical protein